MKRILQRKISFYTLLLCVCYFVSLEYIGHGNLRNFKQNFKTLREKLASFNYNSSINRKQISENQTSNGYLSIYTKISNVNSSSFLNAMTRFSWDKLETSLRQENRSNFLTLSSELLMLILPFITMPPKVGVNHSCVRPVLKIPSYLPTCVPLQKPRKVGVLLQFGFEVDILEIHLNELMDVVDYFFVLESIRSHFLGIRKPLIWEDIKTQDRFRNFSEKIVHLVLDDSDLVTSTIHGHFDAKLFRIENLQEELRWQKFVGWNNRTQYFKDDDILGFGDVDEIPSRDVIFYLKHCEMPTDPVDIGIWFPFGKINQAFQTDWPVTGHPFSLGDPTYWTIKASSNATKFPTRNRGRSLGHLLGGMHMAHYGYLPVQIVEFFTASESNFGGILTYLAPKLRKLSSESLREFEIELSTTPEGFKDRIISIESFKRRFPEEYKQIVHIPWYYNCNRNRYPLWEGLHDTRIY